MKTTTLAFDVYGTLIDTSGVITKLETIMGDHARQFAQTWRDKQLEYAFRRGLMQKYQPFSVCTSQALDYTCAFSQLLMTPKQKQELLDCYRTLPTFQDVEPGLNRLKSAGFNLFAFSNGSVEAVEGLLTHASIMEYFIGIVSVDDIKTFKPDPAVYRYFLT